MINEGEKVKAITLPDEEGKKYKVKYPSVVFFYPKDDTPGCTLEAKGFSKLASKFKKLGVDLVGISGGTSASKEKFCKKHKLSVKLLADEDFEVSKLFGVYGDKKFMGKTYKGIKRTTFVIDKKGKVVKVYDSVKPESHPEEVLEFLKGIDSE
jgi:peroxiredoxin Q/BCP